MVTERLYDVVEAAEVLHVSVSLVHHLTSKRQIGFLRLGKKLFFTTADLEKYAAGRRVEAAIEPQPGRSRKASSRAHRAAVA